MKRGYDPDVDDGVIPNMAPLHELIPWPEPKKYWEDLEKGRYDWAHLAMKYWLERVKEKCPKDKSLAIAQSLDKQYWPLKSRKDDICDFLLTFGIFYGMNSQRRNHGTEKTESK